MSRGAVASAFLARLLHDEFGPPDHSEDLAAFQQAGVTAVEKALDLYGGALLADEVGLGKTHLAAVVASRREPVVVCAPAHLCPMWEAMCPSATTLSHAQLSRGAPAASPRLVIVDEAQRFSNPASARYRALAGAFPEAGMLLVTATPMGMRRQDLVALMRLFIPPGGMVHVLGDDLDHWIATPRPDWTLLRETVLIRRSRATLEALFPDGIQAGDTQLFFPTTSRRKLTWAPHPDALRAVMELAEALEGATVLGLPPGLVRTLLLTRLASSLAAVDGTLSRFCGFLGRRQEARRCGRDLDRDSWRRFFGGLGADLDRQTVLPFLFDAPGAAAPEVEAVGHCLDLIAATRRTLSGCTDRKPASLEGALDPQRTTLIFTHSAETALTLFDTLRRAQPQVGLGLLRGDGGRIGGDRGQVSAEEVLIRFRPDFAPAQGRITWLVATDVLSEGANLQHCTCVVSYDVPWNPLRLVQRHGRVDRLGRRHREVEVITMLPTGPLEDSLALIDRVARRAADVEAALGDTGTLAQMLGAALPAHSDDGETALLELRLEQCRLPPTTAGPTGVAAPGRAADFFAFDLGIRGASRFWCAVERTCVSTRRAAIAERLLALRVATPLRAPSPRPFREALSAALAQRRRLCEALARPLVHSLRSAAGRLLRRLAQHKPPHRADPRFASWVLIHAHLRRRLTAPVARRIHALLEREEIDLDALGASLGPPPGSSVSDEVELVAFVRWGE